ncbi:hypothetical protein [Desulfonatronovibrio magnus]|uniref:hypothetical protein n=1 Tax=Desulfonatronovibrio magnus TaxID=698827 RepID=UPI0005EB353D|nr:hypothetical protein [Desulfonatronovibrio magnus]
MDKRYLLMKCRANQNPLPIDCFTANSMTEAQEALKWLREHHPDRHELQLEPGEFFEILVEEHCPSNQWQEIMAELEHARKKRKSS